MPEDYWRQNADLAKQLYEALKAAQEWMGGDAEDFPQIDAALDRYEREMGEVGNA